MADRKAQIVLVTGGSGFVASHLTLQLLTSGFTVRSTIRTLEHERHIRESLIEAGLKTESTDRLTFHLADLASDNGWEDAIRGCTYVHHVASPFPSTAPTAEENIITTARDGTLRVLRFARDLGVQRVIMTSSFAAIGYGHGNKQSFTEKDWSAVQSIPAYHKSKTIAEQAAWRFIETEGGLLELTTINPVGVFGPILNRRMSSSIKVIRTLMDGSMQSCPRIYFNVIDVRDLADLHIRAILALMARGQRFIGSSDHPPYSLLEVAKIINRNRPNLRHNIPAKEMPSLLIRFAAIFNAKARQIVPALDVRRDVTNEKAKRLLSWEPMDSESTILANVDSLAKQL